MSVRTPRARGLALAAFSVMVAACSRDHDPERTARRAPMPLPVEVFADSGAAMTLPFAPMPPEPTRPAPARLTLVDIAPLRGQLTVTAPEPEPGEPPATAARAHETPAADDSLQPPIPRGPARLTLPARARRGDAVELDVRVDEMGSVSDALWAGGSRDSALVAAATDAALGMRFYPALRGGRPVAVWCRQRVDVDR